MQQLREPVRWRKMGEGWEGLRREEEGGRASSALVEGREARHCWRGRALRMLS